MARPKPATPRANLQVEMPVTLIAALDLLASRANNGSGITRSHLVRAILAEYVELKLGPDLRKAIAVWDKHGGDLLMTFMKQQLGEVTAHPVSVDPMLDRNYNASPLDDSDPLHKLAEKTVTERKESVYTTENTGHKSGEEYVPVATSVESEFAIKNDLQAPRVTESQYLAQDPERALSPLPTHFPVRRDDPFSI